MAFDLGAIHRTFAKSAATATVAALAIATLGTPSAHAAGSFFNNPLQNKPEASATSTPALSSPEVSVPGVGTVPPISRGMTRSEEFDAGVPFSLWNQWGFSQKLADCRTLPDGTEDCKIERSPEDRNKGNEENSILAQYSRKAPKYTEITKTRQPYECTSDVVSKRVKEIDKKYGFVETLQCYGSIPDKFPTRLEHIIGASFVYPTAIESAPEGKTFPVAMLGPGFTAEPGMQDRLATMLAQQGFIVVTTYSTVNALGEQFLAGAVIADKANEDASHPLHGHFDFTRSYLGGHSASAGAAVGMNGIIEK